MSLCTNTNDENQYNFSIDEPSSDVNDTSDINDVTDVNGDDCDVNDVNDDNDVNGDYSNNENVNDVNDDNDVNDVNDDNDVNDVNDVIDVIDVNDVNDNNGDDCDASPEQKGDEKVLDPVSSADPSDIKWRPVEQIMCRMHSLAKHLSRRQRQLTITRHTADMIDWLVIDDLLRLTSSTSWLNDSILNYAGSLFVNEHNRIQAKKFNRQQRKKKKKQKKRLESKIGSALPAEHVPPPLVFISSLDICHWENYARTDDELIQLLKRRVLKKLDSLRRYPAGIVFTHNKHKNHWVAYVFRRDYTYLHFDSFGAPAEMIHHRKCQDNENGDDDYTTAPPWNNWHIILAHFIEPLLDLNHADWKGFGYQLGKNILQRCETDSYNCGVYVCLWLHHILIMCPHQWRRYNNNGNIKHTERDNGTVTPGRLDFHFVTTHPLFERAKLLGLLKVATP